MSRQREIEKQIKVQEFRKDANKFLDKSEKEYIQYALKEYTKYRSVSVLMKGLLTCLNSPEKLDLLPVIRELLPKNDHKEYDLLAPYKKMAHPNAGNRRARSKSNQFRTIWLEKTRRQPLGFSIRGGKEMSLGIYVSQVESRSKADGAGMQVGDQIIEVNGISFEWISHESAVTVFKSFNEFKIVMWNVGKLPKLDSVTGKAYIWVDPLGRPIKESGLATNDKMDMYNDDDDHILFSDDKRRIVINKKPGHSFGLKIRGGKEFNLGIFVVEVEPGSQCEEHGLRVGDQILSVNKTSFKNILHHEAAAILKNNSILIMTIKSVGRIPKLLSSNHVDDSDNSDKEEKDTIEDRKFNSLPRSAHLCAPSDFRQGLTESPRFSRKFPIDRSPSTLSEKQSSKRGVSPLATNTKATVSADDSPVFEYGIGTQVMLASSVYNPIREKLIDSASKVLNKDEVDAMKRKLADYEDGGKLDILVEFLIIVLDKPNKVELLNDVRPMLQPKDLARFDKLVSRHEMEAMNKKRLSSNEDKKNPTINKQANPQKTKSIPSSTPTPSSPPTKSPLSPPESPIPPPESPLPPPESPLPPPESPLPPPESPPESPPPPPESPLPPPPPPSADPIISPNTAKNYQTVLKDLENPPELRKVETIQEVDEEKEEIEGAFGNPAAKQVLEKAKQSQRESTLQSRESFLAWNENYPVRDKVQTTESRKNGKEQKSTNNEKEEPLPIPTEKIISPGKPLSIVIEKTAFFLGLDIRKDSKGNMVIEEIIEDGAAFNDGFLQPGFIILKVNEDDLTGLPLGDAETILNENYDSDQPTIELVVSVVAS